MILPKSTRNSNTTAFSNDLPNLCVEARHARERSGPHSFTQSPMSGWRCQMTITFQLQQMTQYDQRSCHVEVASAPDIQRLRICCFVVYLTSERRTRGEATSASCTDGLFFFLACIRFFFGVRRNVEKNVRGSFFFFGACLKSFLFLQRQLSLGSRACCCSKPFLLRFFFLRVWCDFCVSWTPFRWTLPPLDLPPLDRPKFRSFHFSAAWNCGRGPPKVRVWAPWVVL